MACHVETNDLSATEFHKTLGALGIAQHRAARLFGVSPRSVRRWQRGDRRVPSGVGIVFRLLAAGVVTVAQVERAAVLVPARTNGSAKSEPPAPLLLEPAPEPTQAAAPADSGLTTAEKVYALAPKACRWPYGDPGRPDFRFCGNPVAEWPYCEQHRVAAYVARQTHRKTPSPRFNVRYAILNLPRTCPAVFSGKAALLEKTMNTELLTTVGPV